MPYAAQIRKREKFLLDTGKFLYEHSDFLAKKCDESKDPIERLVLSTLSSLCGLQGMEHRITFSQTEDLLALFDLIEKLPKGPEFDEIREAVRKTNERVRETLEPIKEAYDKAKNFEKRMTENGVYA